MNSLLLFNHEQIEERLFVLTDAKRIQHVGSHLKKGVGDTIKISVVDSGIGQGLIRESSPEHLMIQISELAPGFETGIELLVGLSRPPTCKKVLEHGTSLGIRGFHFFKAELSEKSYLDSKLFEKESWAQSVHDGLSQGGSLYRMPAFSLTPYLSLSESQNFKNKILLSLSGGESLASFKIDPSERTLLAIGPERGFTPQEEELLTQSGFLRATLGTPTLRVEIATYAALAQILGNR
jgi:RsmE family RNA methyltransferase